MSNVAKGVDYRVGHRTLAARSREGGRDPGERDVVRAEKSTKHEKEGDIARRCFGGGGRDNESVHDDEYEGKGREMVSLSSAEVILQQRVDTLQDSPDHSHSKGNRQMEATLRFPITHATDDNGEDCGDKVRRGGKEQSDLLGEAKGLNDSGEELGDSASRGLGDDDDGKKVELWWNKSKSVTFWRRLRGLKEKGGLDSLDSRSKPS